MNRWMRTLHRLVALVFTLVVGAVFVVQATQEEPAEWVFLTPLPLLALLWLTGMYLYVLPYFARKRRAPPADPTLSD